MFYDDSKTLGDKDSFIFLIIFKIEISLLTYRHARTSIYKG